MRCLPGVLFSSLILLNCSPAISSSCPWDLPDLQPWSDTNTWGGSPPQDGDTVTVTTPILLDTWTPRIKLLDIRDGGRLVFSSEVEPRLTAGVVRIIHNGSLLVGGPDCRYPGQAEIVLIGGLGADETMGELTKGIYVKTGGNLDIHGEEKLSWTKLEETLYSYGYGEYVLALHDEPHGWVAGDRLVISSTDYDMYQAEEVEVVSCGRRGEVYTCIVRGDIKYTHYGGYYKGVDMRAEVGILTRNIKISGEVEDEYDTYGGHIKAYEGHETYRIRGAELTKMGQQGLKGRYPIHFHMNKNVDANKSYARENSIHHVFQRCITVHGTHGTIIEDNVAYNTFGHCYFLEDGGEKNNTYHHNLGLVTQAMLDPSTIPSDRFPATFWITSPLTTLVDNSAAGSDGVGIWFIFAENVTGPSASEGFFAPGEAFRTPVTLFDTNSVHSSETGFLFGSELLPDQDFSGAANFGGTEKCRPKTNPLDPNSDPATNFVTRLTAFKNRAQNVWNDCDNTTFHTLHSSDARLGITMKHDNIVTKSVFVGESDNLGEPNMVRLRNGTKVMWHRSHPGEFGGYFLGIHLYDGNPIIDGNTFSDFKDDELKYAGAIGFRKAQAGVIPTVFLNSYFTFEDKIEGNYIKGFPKDFLGYGPAERGIVFDWDGTITGIPLSTVVRDTPFYSSSWCEPRPHWGDMSICPHRYSEAGGSGSGYGHIDVVVTRDDVPEYPDIAMDYHDPWHLHLSTDHSYIFSFRNNSLPENYLFKLYGLDSGFGQNVGFCVPLGISEDDISFKGNTELRELNTYEDLLADRTGDAYYWDREVGVVFRRFQVDQMRAPENQVRCLPDNKHCPSFRIKTELEERGDTDCTERAYPKYRKDPVKMK